MFNIAGKCDRKMTKTLMKPYVGVGGWTYEPWRGVFIYFIHEAKLRAPAAAMALIERPK